VSDIREFDVVVLGAGPAGEVCAGRLAENDLSVALLERELIGGECSFYACMPSKALLRPAQALAEARRVPGAAEAAGGELDVDAVLRRRDEIVHHLEDSAQLPWLEERSITLVRGHGVIEREREVRVGAELLRARRAVVLAPGSTASIPPIDGLREAQPWTNREVTTASAIPASLLVLGGGVVGVEMAHAYASLGAHVTIVEASQRLIVAEEEFASELLRESLESLGVEVVLGAKATAVRRDPAEAGSSAEGSLGPVTLELEDGRSFTGQELLVAVGRRARTDALGLESLGLEPGEPIAVDDTMRVPGHDWLYVVGDANGRVLLTHMGKYQARIAAEHILGRSVALLSDGRLAPRVIFTEPQVAAVGHTLASAKDAGLNVRAVDKPVEANAGGSFVGHDAPGTVRLVVEEDRCVIVGATFTGVDVAESLHAATVAIIGEVPLERLRHAVPCFPTRSEVWLALLES
jgi:pyruvate/2-oxoglutarate dehydrogenase complex dihydrolipoamide dehydrogenase (E3) component